MQNNPNRWTAAMVTAIVLTIAVTACKQQEEPTDFDVQALASDSSEYQQEILRDGVVTADEYEAALLSSRDCIAAAGGIPGEIVEMDGNQLGFETLIEAETEEAGKKISDALRTCNSEYFYEVSQVWAYQNILSPEEREERRPKVIGCLNDAGLSIDDSADKEVILESANQAIGTPNESSVTKCLQEYPEYFQVAPETS